MNLLKRIKNYPPYNPQEEQDKKVFLNYLISFNNCLVRENEFGHVSSSAFVLNKERTKVIMVYHNIYDSWGWVGGHADGDADLLNIAIKEAREETGLKNVKPIDEDIFILDILSVSGHKKREKYVSSHVHLNITFLLEADEREALHIKEDENSGVKWVPINKIVEYSRENQMKKVYTKAIEKMKKQRIL
ncbi:MAG: NUDIX hydrolase [Candidatus Dojkabacteria bacterium]|jgi:8-oxo-dGTP pyrophosphatase MutT (NUDIX family)